MARSFKQRGTVVVPLAESPIPMVEVESIDNPAIFRETIAGEGNITGLTVYGKSTQDGTPSPESPVPIVSAGDGGSVNIVIHGDNKIPLLNTSSFLSNGLNVEYANGILKVHGTCSAYTWINIYPFVMNGTDTNYLGTPISGTIGFISCDSPFDAVKFRNESNPNEQVTISKGSKSVSLTEAVAGIFIEIAEGNVVDFEGYIGISDGFVNFPISTPTGLPGIPVNSGGNYTDAEGQQWVCDEVDFARGMYVQRIGHGILDGTIFYFKPDSSAAYWNVLNSAPGLDAMDYVRSNAFPFGVLLGNFDNDYIYSKPNLITPYFQTVDELNAFLVQKNTEGNPVEFYYIRTPIETPLPPEELTPYRALHTYDGTTVITVNSDPIDPGVKTTVKVIDPNSGNPQIMQLWLDKEGHPVNINGRGARVGGTPTQQYIMQPCSF